MRNKMSNKLNHLKNKLQAYKHEKTLKENERVENKNKIETLQDGQVVSDLIETGQCLYIDIAKEIIKRKKEIKKADVQIAKLNKNIGKTEMLLNRTK